MPFETAMLAVLAALLAAEACALGCFLMGPCVGHAVTHVPKKRR